MSDVNITYETLYEILRNEKNREDIQELSVSFYEDIVSYLNKSTKIMQEALNSGQPEEDIEDLARQMKNIKSIIKEIYERREKKIINFALNKSRTSSDSMEIETLLVEEKEMYERVVEVMDCFRNNIISRALLGKIPISNKKTCAVDIGNEIMHDTKTGNVRPHPGTEDISIKNGLKDREIARGDNGNESENNAKKIDAKDREAEEKEKQEINASAMKNPGQAKEEMQKKAEYQQHSATSDSTKIDKSLRFKEAVPKFLGKELEVYGPYEPEETAILPTELANILIRKGKAEEIIEA